jgi:uncharacterized membrane protein YidH (DUF202 family)
MVVYAQEHIEAAQSIVSRIENAILFPILSFMLAVAFLYFMWGAYEFVANAESDSGRDTGKQHMLYGIIGMVVMVSALALLRIVAGTFGVDVNTQ